jgi:hypothetical protein
MKNSDKKYKYHRICIFLNDDEMENLYQVVYKEKSIPSKIFRKALMEYIEKSLFDVKNKK